MSMLAGLASALVCARTLFPDAPTVSDVAGELVRQAVPAIFAYIAANPTPTPTPMPDPSFSQEGILFTSAKVITIALATAFVFACVYCPDDHPALKGQKLQKRPMHLVTN